MTVKLSHSQMAEWFDTEAEDSTGCRFKWALKRIWRAPQHPNESAIVGDGLHAAIEADGLRVWRFLSNEANKGKTMDRLSIGELVEIARAKIDARIKESDPTGVLSSRRSNMMQRVESMVLAYVRHVQVKYRPTQKPEKGFTLKIGDVPFTGKIDAKGVDILDWKNAKEIINKWGKEWNENEEHGDQATAYMIADPFAPSVTFVVFACHPDDPTTCIVKTYQYKKDIDRELRYQHRVQRIAREIEQAKSDGVFPADTKVLCGWCDVLGSCTFGQQWLNIAKKKIGVALLDHVSPCICGQNAKATDYRLVDGKATIVWTCEYCGIIEEKEVVKKKHEEEPESDD